MSKLQPVRCGCGGEAVLETDHDTIQPIAPIDWKRVRCNKCNIRTTWRKSEAEAVEAWNRAMGADKNSIVSVFSSENIAKIDSVTLKYQGFGDGGKLYAYGYICQNCDGYVREGDKYCSQCGMKLEWNNYV